MSLIGIGQETVVEDGRFFRDRVSTQESGNASSDINNLGLRINRCCVEANRAINQWLDMAMDERSSSTRKGWNRAENKLDRYTVHTL
jgi:hypothetical protein